MASDIKLRVLWLPTGSPDWQHTYCSGFAANREAVYFTGLDGQEEVISWDFISGLSVAPIPQKEVKSIGKVIL